MNGLREHLSGYYRSQNPPADLTERLAAAIPAARPANALQRRLRKFIWACGVAAGFALLAFGNVYFAWQTYSLRQELTRLQNPPQAKRSEKPVLDVQPNVRFVALHICGDQCRTCPRIYQYFEKMRRQYGERAVQFVMLDASSEETRRRGREAIGTASADWIMPCCQEQGPVMLFDCARKELLAEAKDAEQMPELEKTLAAALGGG